MNRFFENLSAGWSNNHIRWPVIGAVVLELIPVWLPAWKDQCLATQKVLAGYALIAAHNSGPTVPAVPPLLTK